MKKIKYFILLAILIIVNNTICQIRIGYTPEEIKLDFKNNVTLSGITNKGNKTLAVLGEDMLSIYVFDKDSLSIQTFLLPQNNETLEKYLSMFNSQCKKLQVRAWLMKSSSGILLVQFIRNKYIYFLISRYY